MNIYNSNYKPRKPRIIPEGTGTKFDLDKISGRNIAIGTDRWKWSVAGTKVSAVSEEGERLQTESYIITGYDDSETYEHDKYKGSTNTSITPAVISTWIRRNKK